MQLNEPEEYRFRGKIEACFAETKKKLSSWARSHSAHLTSYCKKLIEYYEEGDLSQDQVEELFTLAITQSKQGNRFVTDWHKRFLGKVPSK